MEQSEEDELVSESLGQSQGRREYLKTCKIITDYTRIRRQRSFIPREGWRVTEGQTGILNLRINLRTNFTKEDSKNSRYILSVMLLQTYTVDCGRYSSHI